MRCESKLEGPRALGLALLAAFVVRFYLFLYTPVIARDGTYYIDQAQLMAQGAWRQAVGWELEPLFPFSIFLVHTLLPDWELAGKVASLTFGVLAIVPFFLISRDMFGPRIAFGAGILFALHPYFARNSVEALTDSTYLFFALLSLWLALKALKHHGILWHLLCAMAILLSSLARGEGIWLFLALWLFFGLLAMPHLRRREWAGTVSLVRFSLAFLAVMIPVSVYSTQIGYFSALSAPKGLGGLAYLLRQVPEVLQVGLARLGSVEGVGQAVASLWKGFLYKFFQIFHPLLFFLTLFALFQKSWRCRYRDHFLLTSGIAIVYLFGPFLLWFTLNHSGHRYLMLPVAVALPWAAVTIGLAADRLEGSVLAERWRARIRKWSVVSDQWSGIAHDWRTILLAAVVLILAAKTVQPQRLDKLPIKEAGAWIAEQGLKEPVILAADGRVAFYAKGRKLQIEYALDNIVALEQVEIAQRLIDQATSQNIKFVFLKGRLDREVQAIVLASAAVKEIREWQSPHGNAYTLIQLK
ncbi:MAG: ArnT family glycosyltransferase [Candidatus Methylomirabilales bacterium]